MSVNLLQDVQEALGYPELQKMDPNTQKMFVNSKTPDEDLFSQAAIPSVLTGFYKYSQTDKGAVEILNGLQTEGWMPVIFKEQMQNVIESVSAYSKLSPENTVVKMEAIAAEAVKRVHGYLSADAKEKEVKDLFNQQSKNILLYLPAALNMGALLNDNVLDDQTNKMEGPLSSLMQSIGNAFSAPVMDDETKSP